MFKLIRYEFRKQLFSKFVILAVFAVFEIFFLYNIYYKDSEQRAALSSMLLVFLVVGILTFIAFESIVTYSRDLKTKQSYMLFLVPQSAYTIMRAKIITAFVQLFLSAIIFMILGIIDFSLMMAHFEYIKSFVEVVDLFFTEFMKMDLKFEIFALLFVIAVLVWFLTIITAMLSITMSSTFLSNSKLKGLISAAAFAAVMYLSTKLIDIMLPGIDEMTVPLLVVVSLILLTISFIEYLAAAWMLDKKISV